MQVQIVGRHIPTGRTRHYRGDSLLPSPASLQVARGDGGFYLLYLDAEGEEQTDTWHETLDGALGQAEFEFGVRPDEWERVN